MLAMDTMDTTGPLEYGPLEHDKTDGSLLIYIYLYVQKCTENYNNRTSNTRKHQMDPVRRNVTDKWDKKKNKTKICNTCNSNPATRESKIVCLYDPFRDGGQTAWNGYSI